MHTYGDQTSRIRRSLSPLKNVLQSVPHLLFVLFEFFSVNDIIVFAPVLEITKTGTDGYPFRRAISHVSQINLHIFYFKFD